MVYKGSKSRIAKHIVPILQNSIDEMRTGLYIEPFVGGANIIDKIEADVKVGCDNNPYLIELLKKVQKGELNIETFTEEQYHYVKNNRNEFEDWELGLYGFCGSYGSKFFDTFARGKKPNGDLRDMPKERINNLKRQSENIKDVEFKCCDFKTLVDLKGYTIYCDPPYKGTSSYGNEFNYDEFYKWCIDMSKDNNVFVSEYDLPIGDVIWSGEIRSSINNASKRENAVEKLYFIKGVDI